MELFRNACIEEPNVKYQINVANPIGEGAFAKVYHAIDKDNNQYAIKRIPLKKLGAHIDKFLLELKISTEIKHINIVKSFEVFKTNKNWYIVTEFCNGGTLVDVMIKLKNVSLIPIERELICKKYLTQLKNALRYLHKSNIMHRDLKPANILITTENGSEILKLADFGFSRYLNAVDDEPIMHSFCGTPLYMAPELLIDKQYMSGADLWSFGVIMYEMLYGTNPYSYPESISCLVDMIKTKEIKFGVFSDDCQNLLKSLLNVDPDGRINWTMFFKHPWFDKQIPSGLSADSMYGSSDNLGLNNDSPPSNTSALFSEDAFDDEYEVIKVSELSPCNYQSCREEEQKSSGLVQIFTNSVNYCLGLLGHS